jgi:hypothetical protein
MGRGIALVFTAAGIAGLTMSALARRSRSYRLLASRYEIDGSSGATGSQP